MDNILTEEDKIYLTGWIFQYLDRSEVDYSKGSLSNQDRAKYIVELVEGQLKRNNRTIAKAQRDPAASIKDKELQKIINEALKKPNPKCPKCGTEGVMKGYSMVAWCECPKCKIKIGDSVIY